MKVMRILLADDHALFREGIAFLLSSRPDLKLVGEAKDGLEAIKLAREKRPDIILMDLEMPRCDGLEALKILTAEMPNVAVVMMALWDDDGLREQAFKNGAKGYLLKNLEPPDLYRLLDQIRQSAADISGGEVVSGTPQEFHNL